LIGCIIKCIVAFWLSLVALPSGQSAHAQTLFGNRGPLSQPRAGSGTSSSGSLFSANAGFPTSSAIRQAQAPTGSFVGRGTSSGFVGSRTGGQSAEAPVRGERVGERQRSVERPIHSPTARDGITAERSNRPRRKSIRPRHMIAFAYQPRSPSEVSQLLKSRLENIAESNPEFTGITAEVGDDGQVTLIGHVASTDTCRLAEIVVRLEPGVRSVKNELTVKAPLPGNQRGYPR
jgi:osmotically-inducible protein OsmY